MWARLRSFLRAARRRFPSTQPSLSERYPKYRFGRGTYGDLTVLSWGEPATLEVGSYTSIAAGVKLFLGGEHRYDWVTTFPFSSLWQSARHVKGHPKTKGDVHIGSDVWVGAEAMIMSGVTIADGAVVAARSVVTRDVAPYSIVAGNPAREVKRRFDQKTIGRLMAISWWQWNESEIQRAMPYLLSNDIEKFLLYAEMREIEPQDNSGEGESRVR